MALALLGCGNDLVGAVSSSSTSSGTEGGGPTTASASLSVTSADSSAEAGECPVGAIGCPCTGGGACDAGLECLGGTCDDPSCSVGSAGCACGADGACDPGLDCVDENCIDPGGTDGCPVGSGGCPCTAGGACDPGFQCDNGACVDDPAGGSSGSSTGPTESSSEGGNRDCGNGLIDEGEICDDGDEIQGNGCNNDCQESASELWTIGYDGPDGLDDEALGVATFPNGDFVVTGFREVAGEGFDIVTRKYDPDGALLWERSHDGPGAGHDISYSVAVDLDLAIIVGGREDNSYAWIRKYDTDGATLWTRTFPEGPSSSAYGVATDQAGDIVVVGNSNEVGQGANTWIRKYTADGDEIWTVLEDQGNGDNDQAYGVAIDPADSIVVAGGMSVLNGSQGWGRGYDADGNLLWSQQPPGSTILWGAAAFATDEVYLASTSSASQARVHKLDEDGQILWTQNYAPAMGFGEGQDVVTDSAGAVVLCGVHGTDDIELLTRKYSAGGSSYWTRTYAGVDSAILAEIAFDVAVDGDDNVIVVGYENVDGQEDWWIRKYAP